MEAKLKLLLRNKNILVIGGTGSWGSELVRQVVKYKPKEIRIYSRGEHKQVEMRRNYANQKNFRFIIGDIRDADSLSNAMSKIDIVFNLAALKHVPVCEENVWEAIQTNVNGVHNLVDGAINNNVKTVVQVSTDKAVDPVNLYGYTKGCAERLVTSANFSPTNPVRTKFVCVRGGNVLSTTGSVVPLFKHLIQKHNKVTITDKNMSRYLMRVEEAIKLVLKAAVESVGGEVYVIKMPAAKITDLSDVMIDVLGNKKTKTEYIGIRPGEKMYEVLVSSNEAFRTIEDGKYYVILPDTQYEKIKNKKYKKNKFVKFKEYNSMNAEQLNKKEILALLERDGWLNNEKDTYFSNLFSTVEQK